MQVPDWAFGTALIALVVTGIPTIGSIVTAIAKRRESSVSASSPDPQLLQTLEALQTRVNELEERVGWGGEAPWGPLAPLSPKVGDRAKAPARCGRSQCWWVVRAVELEDGLPAAGRQDYVASRSWGRGVEGEASLIRRNVHTSVHTPLLTHQCFAEQVLF